MFEKFFKDKKEINLQCDDGENMGKKTPASQGDSATDSLLRAIAEKKKTDPQIGLKIGAQEMNSRLMGALKNEKGVHVESLLGILGALGGFSCQMAIREEFIKTGKISEKEIFTIIGTNDGKKFYFGDALNKLLAENPYSIWGLVGGAAQQAGCQKLPDIHEIFSYVAKSVGGKEFGIPRVPDAHKANDLPINYVKNLWPKLCPVLNMFCDKPSEWPVLYGMAIYKIIDMAKTTIEPGLAAQIAMEFAVPMSKIDPVEVGIYSPSK